MTSILRRILPFGYRQQQEGPPDLEDAFKKMWSNVKNKKKSGNGPRDTSGGKSGSSKFGFALIGVIAIVVIIGIWGASGFFVVQPAEQGVVLQFGKYNRTVQPGLHWMARFIESKYVVNVDQVNAIKLSQEMLTQGENFVQVSFAVQYKIANLKDFLFNIQDPVRSLKEIVDSAVRQVVGTSSLDDILTVGRGQITLDIKKQIEKLVARYKNGIDIVSVQMQPAQPPTEVQAAFDDVIKAREDNQRLQNEAEGYANKIVPIAKGQANAMLKHAHAVAKQAVLLANGKVAMFNALLPKYKAAPNVTANRMYFNTMEKVLHNSRVVLLAGGKQQGNLTVLPLRQLLAKDTLHSIAASAEQNAVNSARTNSTATTTNGNSTDTSETNQYKMARIMEAQQ